MIQDLFSVTVLIGILASGIRLATPYLYAAIGETFGQKSGVLNLGVEGQMLLGAFAAFYVSLKTGNLWLGRVDRHAGRRSHGAWPWLCDRQPAGPAGHQRHRVLPLRPGDERPAFPEVDAHGGDHTGVPEDPHPRLERHPGHRRDLLRQNILVYMRTCWCPWRGSC
jgi:hypothetical protein